MDNEPMVIGIDAPEREPDAGRRSWPVVVGGVIAGLAVGVLIGTGSRSVEPTEAEIVQAEQVRERIVQQNLSEFPELREPPARVERRPLGLPLNELVPRFGDVLIVGLLDADGDSVYQLVWGPGASSPARIATLDDAAFDLSGKYFARFETSLWNGRMLALGDLSSQSTGPVAIGADGFVWHSSEGARLAWTGEIEQGRRALFTADVVRRAGDGTLDVTWVTDIGSARLLAWDDWGFALESDGETILLGPSGIDLGRTTADFLGSGDAGAIVVRDGATLLAGAADDLAGLAEPWWASRIDGDVVAVRPAPSRAILAVEAVTSAGTGVYLVSSEDLVRLDLEGAEPLAWSSDGAYLILRRQAPDGAVLLFHSAADNETFELEMTDPVGFVAVRGPT